MTTNALKSVDGAAITTVIDLTADLTNNSVAGGTTLFDNSTDRMWYAVATFNNPGTFGAAPTANSTVNLYAVLQDTDGTNDDTATPTGTTTESARFMGAFPIYAVDEEQRVSIDIDIRGIKKCYFFIENKCGQTIIGTASHIYVKIEPNTPFPSV